MNIREEDLTEEAKHVYTTITERDLESALIFKDFNLIRQYLKYKEKTIDQFINHSDCSNYILG